MHSAVFLFVERSHNQDQTCHTRGRITNSVCTGNRTFEQKNDKHLEYQQNCPGMVVHCSMQPMSASNTEANARRKIPVIETIDTEQETRSSSRRGHARTVNEK